MSKPALPFAEFIALIAVMFAMIAFGSDAMLPLFPEIARDLGVSEVNRVQLVITVFILGSGVGQLFTGPLSDSLGRKPVILGGLLVYMLASAMAAMVNSLEMLLLARFIQGVGVSAPRTVTIAMVRDIYAGRMMARVMSFAMVLFVLVPAVAPLVGQTTAQLFGWRSIFLSFIIFALFGFFWLYLRQPETHAKENRRRMQASAYISALKEVLTSRIVMTYTVVLAFGLGALFGFLSSAQQVFVDVFDAGLNFPLYFAVIALISGVSGIANAALVLRFGMRQLAQLALGFMLVITLCFIFALAAFNPDMTTVFPFFMFWALCSFFVPGLTFGNLNALAMEPMGHIAGMASAIMGAVSTALGVLIAIPIGLAFDGSIMPLLIGFVLCNGGALTLMLTDPKDHETSAAD